MYCLKCSLVSFQSTDLRFHWVKQAGTEKTEEEEKDMDASARLQKIMDDIAYVRDLKANPRGTAGFDLTLVSPEVVFFSLPSSPLMLMVSFNRTRPQARW